MATPVIDITPVLVGGGVAFKPDVGRPVNTKSGFCEDGRIFASTPVGSYNNRTYQLVVTAEAPFSAIRLLVGNADTANPALISAAAVAATGATADLNPSSGAMTVVTFDGASSYTIPACAGAARPLQRWSDWIPVTSVPRTDGGSLPVAILRVDIGSTALAVGVNVMNAVWNTSDTDLAGRFTQSTREASGRAFVTNWVTTSFFNQSPIIAVEFRHAVPAVTVATFGDSITEGSALVTKQFLNHFHRGGFAVSTQAAPLSVLNFGRAGETTQQYFQRTLDFLYLKDANGNYINKPAAITYSIGSPNDGDMTAAVARAAKSRAYQVLDACQQRGVIFMPVSTVPRVNSTNTASSNTDDSIRRAFNAELMALAGPNIIPIDVATAVQDVGSPSLYASSSYVLADGVHPTDAAMPYMAAPVAAAFALIGAR
jgi:lysophospholipase L1-like esterase